MGPVRDEEKSGGQGTTATHSGAEEGKSVGGEQGPVEEAKARMLRRTFWTTGFATFFYYFEVYFGINATFAYQAMLSKGDMGVAAGYTSLFQSLTSVIGVVATPWIGTILERFGRKPVLLSAPIFSALGRLIMVAAPSWTTFFLNHVTEMLGFSMISLGIETTFTDLAEGTQLAQAFARSRIFMGISLIASAPVGVIFHQRFGNTVTHLGAIASEVVAALLIILMHRETKGLFDKEKEAGGAVAAKPGGGRSAQRSPVAFLLLFRDATLAKLAGVSCLMSACDNTWELDGIYLRTELQLNPDQVGKYYTFRGISYLTGSVVAEFLQRLFGQIGYTRSVHLTIFVYLIVKARARNFGMVVTFLLIYSLGPMMIRNSSVNALFYERGISLGYTREALVAAMGNMNDWFRMLMPLAYGQVYRRAPVKAYMYYLCAGIIVLSQLLFTTVNFEKIPSTAQKTYREARLSMIKKSAP